MAKLVMIVGDTGSGKSTAIEDLNPKETFVINCLNKPLPFKGSGDMYCKANCNTISTTDVKSLMFIMDEINKKQLHIKNLIIDDSGFIMTEMFFAKAMETGYVN